MLTHDEAVDCAALELAHDTELLGTEIVAGSGAATPNFWVFYPNRPLALESSRSADSLSSRIPPLVVDRRTGSVIRPFGPGSRVRAADLGADEWFILKEAEPPDHESLEGFDLTPRDVERVRGLRYFRATEGSRDAGSSLDARFVAAAPKTIVPGLLGAGWEQTSFGWVVGEDRIHGHVDPEIAAVHLSIFGNGVDASPWSFTGRDIEVAERIEASLGDADWIRFWG